MQSKPPANPNLLAIFLFLIPSVLGAAESLAPLNRKVFESPNRRYETPTPVVRRDGSRDLTLRVLFTGDKFWVIGDDSFHGTLELTRNGERIPITVHGARARARVLPGNRPTGPEVSLRFMDSGNHIYAMTFTPRGTILEDHFGLVALEVDYDCGDGRQCFSILDVFYQPANKVPGQFTGTFREEVKNESLLIYAGAELWESGFYVVDANVVDAQGQLVSAFHAKVDLPPGMVEIPLTVLRPFPVVQGQTAVPPFSLTQLRGYRFLLGQTPDRKLMVDHPGFYQIQSRRVENFSAGGR